MKFYDFIFLKSVIVLLLLQGKFLIRASIPTIILLNAFKVVIEWNVVRPYHNDIEESRLFQFYT